MPSLLDIGVSSLIANRDALSTVGHNISNASTEGYSKQEVIYSTSLSQNVGGSGFFGSGVIVSGVRRLVDEQLTEELRDALNNYQRLETVFTNAGQLDDILGDAGTGLATRLQGFFDAFQIASEDPTSVASRQALLGEAGLLVNRFNDLQSFLNDHNNKINAQMSTLTANINTMASSIADLNNQIASTVSETIGDDPNDLLDQRENLLLQLSELVSVSMTENTDGSINVYIGNGQGLVINDQTFELGVAANETDPTRMDVVFTNNNSTQAITNSITGGQLGGLIEFRDEILDVAYNKLGLIAVSLIDLVNDQHQRGMDLTNAVGGFFFTDVNSSDFMESRVVADVDNVLPNDREIEVTIDEIDELTTSDYVLEFSSSISGEYTVTRLSDNTIVARNIFSGVFPSTVEFDGLEVSLESGSFQTGDRFRILPTRFAARDMEVAVTDPRDIALAQPIRTAAGVGNRGTGSISQGVSLDASTSAYATSGDALDPPILIRFTSSTTYEVLDYSDPSNPVALVPPISNQTFVSGASNDIFSENENETGVTSNGTEIGVIQNSLTSNGYSAETIRVTTVDQDTGVISFQTVTTTADDSAATIATALNELTGVTATARNYAVIEDMTSASPMTLTLNGELLTGTDPQTLATSINSNTTLLASGISAQSDGITLTIEATTGVDFVFEVGGGAAGDSIDLVSSTGNEMTITGADTTPSAVIGGTIDVILSTGVTMQGEGNIFPLIPTHNSTYRGYQVSISGEPSEGDEFFIEFNTGGYSDNRNAVAFAEIQNFAIIDGNQATLGESYISLVSLVGTETQQSEIGKEAAETIYNRVLEERNSVAGVNLDEEAAKIVQFEQAYNASAQLITVARSIFDTLIRMVG